MHTALKCAVCGRAHAIDRLQNVCEVCSRPLLAEYDLEKLAATFTPDVVRRRSERSLWKFAEVLPIDRREEAVSLGEGMTPLLPVRGCGPLANFRRLFVKDESFNPTGSFKARGMAAAITRAKALGATTVALPSAGNAGGAAAAYAARAGLSCFVLMPEDTPAANVVEAVVAGAQVGLVKGLISDCGKLIRKACDQLGWFDLSTLKEPFRVEGKKTMGYELAFDCADEATGRLALPDVVFYPTGGGTGLIGMWKAFDEMQRLGWIGSERPRMVAVQAEHCADRAGLRAGADTRRAVPQCANRRLGPAGPGRHRRLPHAHGPTRQSRDGHRCLGRGTLGGHAGNVANAGQFRVSGSGGRLGGGKTPGRSGLD